VKRQLAAFATACLLNLWSSAPADTVPQQNSAEGKVNRDGIDLFYSIVGTSGDYVLVLSGGPGT